MELTKKRMPIWESFYIFLKEIILIIRAEGKLRRCTEMAATSDREMEMLLSSFDQIYQVRAIIPQSVCSSFSSVSSLPLSREKAVNHFFV